MNKEGLRSLWLRYFFDSYLKVIQKSAPEQMTKKEKKINLILTIVICGNYYWLEQYGMIILLVLLMTGIVDVLFNPIFSLLWGLLPFGFPS